MTRHTTGDPPRRSFSAGTAGPRGRVWSLSPSLSLPGRHQTGVASSTRGPAVPSGVCCRRRSPQTPEGGLAVRVRASETKDEGANRETGPSQPRRRREHPGLVPTPCHASVRPLRTVSPHSQRLRSTTSFPYGRDSWWLPCRLLTSLQERASDLCPDFSSTLVSTRGRPSGSTPRKGGEGRRPGDRRDGT